MENDSPDPPSMNLPPSFMSHDLHSYGGSAAVGLEAATTADGLGQDGTSWLTSITYSETNFSDWDSGSSVLPSVDKLLYRDSAVGVMPDTVKMGVSSDREDNTDTANNISDQGKRLKNTL